MASVSIRSSGPGPPTPTSPTELFPANTSRVTTRENENKKEKKLGHRRVTQEGTVTYKKKPTSELQRAIQLGIQHHIGSLQQKPARDVLVRDFGTIETVYFPKEGTKTTPAHALSDFRFRTYSPVAFRGFRNCYKLDIRDFLESLCSRPLRELSNPGASGSIFYISQDDEFIVKTVQHKEGEFLQNLLPEYFINLMQHPRTLLPKYYGLYCYQSGHKNIRFVVMNNLLPSSVRIHEKYDLKGSTYKRQASATERAKSSPTLKDLDFLENHADGVWLEAETYDALMKTIERDCLVLESFRIMDYSLLLGIHNLDQAKRDRAAERRSVSRITSHGHHSIAASGGDDSNVLSSSTRVRSNGLVQHSDDRVGLPDHRPTSRLTSSWSTQRHLSSHPSSSPGAGGESNFTSPVDVIADFKSGQPITNSALDWDNQRGRSQKRLAAYCTALESIEATAEPVELESEERELIPSGGIPARSSTGDRLLLYVGIIDILQSYRLLKKMEHGFKSIAIDGKTISVTHPNYYAQRFQDFLSRVVFKRIQSLDQPTLLGPNALRFRRFVHMAMKNASSKRATRALSASRPMDEPTISTERNTFDCTRSKATSTLSRPDWLTSSKSLQHLAPPVDSFAREFTVWPKGESRRSENDRSSSAGSYVSSASRKYNTVGSKVGLQLANFISSSGMPNRNDSACKLPRRSESRAISTLALPLDFGGESVRRNYCIGGLNSRTGSTSALVSPTEKRILSRLYDIMANYIEEHNSTQLSLSSLSSSEDERSEACANPNAIPLNTNNSNSHSLVTPEKPKVIIINTERLSSSSSSRSLSCIPGSRKSLSPPCRASTMGHRKFVKIDSTSLENFMTDASFKIDSFSSLHKLPALNFDSWPSSNRPLGDHPSSKRNDQYNNYTSSSPRSTLTSVASFQSLPPVPVIHNSFVRRRQLMHKRPPLKLSTISQ